MNEIKMIHYIKKFTRFFTLLLPLISCHTVFGVLTMSQYKPDSYFEKPYFTQDYFTQITTNFSGGFANSAYNNNSSKVPFLQQFGTEDLLNRFVDQSLPQNNIAKFGQGLLSGNFHVRELIVSCYKNMQRGFFLEGATVIQDLSIDAITLTPTQINDEQIEKLEQLQQKLPKSIDQAGMFTTALYAGYHATFLDFKHLDFIDLQLKLGIMSPQAMSHTNQTILQLPFMQNLNFGYPIIFTTSFGVLDWITMGWNGAIIPWQRAMANMTVSHSFSQNALLGQQPTVARVERGPLLTTSIYFEADHFHQNLSALIAYCYTKNFDYTITPLDQINFQKALVNQSPLYDAWSLGSFYLEFSIDFACQAKPNAPVVTLFCNIPITGQSSLQTNIFGGAYAFQISYGF